MVVNDLANGISAMPAQPFAKDLFEAKASHGPDLGMPWAVAPDSDIGSEPVVPEATIHFKGSATEGLDLLAQATTHVELLQRTHELWCGPACPKDLLCPFFHYTRPAELPASRAPSAFRSRYNKETAGLFTLMDGRGYVPGSPMEHRTNLWPLLEGVTQEVDAYVAAHGVEPIRYSDWSKKHVSSAGEAVLYTSRDAVQWMAAWVGGLWDRLPQLAQFTEFAAILDDLAIPPLDLVRGRLQLFGHAFRDVMAVLQRRGWGRDATYMMLTVVRQYLLQYAEKVDRKNRGEVSRAGLQPGTSVGIHAALAGGSIWDSAMYHTYTGNAHGVIVGIARMCAIGPVCIEWINDASICDSMSMSLCKTTLGVYQLDDYQPTAMPVQREKTKPGEHSAKSAYHAMYLDLIDDLVRTGAPDTFVHFARAGFLAVQMHHRYLERRLGRRIAVTDTMRAALERVWGSQSPSDAWLEERFAETKAMDVSGTAV